MSEQETGGRVYELGYLLVPTIAEGDVSNVIEEIKKLLAQKQVSVITEGNAEFIDLAYQMEQIVGSTRNKYNQAYFGWIKFEADPESLEAIKKALDAAENIIRYLLVKTEKGNTVLFKKPKGMSKRESFDAEEPVEDEEISAEESLVEETVEEHEKLPELEDEIEADSTTVDEEEKAV